MNRFANRSAKTAFSFFVPAAVAVAAAVTLLCAAPAHAQSADQVKAEFACSVYLKSLAKPQRSA